MRFGHGAGKVRVGKIGQERRSGARECNRSGQCQIAQQRPGSATERLLRGFLSSWAKDFLDAELKKCKTIKALPVNLMNLLDSKTNEQAFSAIKTKGVGQTTILKFLGGNWKRWAIGDWLADGKRHYGDGLYKRAAEITGQSARTLEDYKRMSDAFEITLRNVELTYNHHKEVAGIKLIAQDKKGKLYLSDDADKDKIAELSQRFNLPLIDAKKTS